MIYSEIVNKVAKELNINSTIVDKTYKAFWLFIRNTIEQLPLKEIESEEEFNKLRTNFNLPSLGKLNCTYNKFKRIKIAYKTNQKVNKNEEIN